MSRPTKDKSLLVPKGTCILREGEVHLNAYLIEEGEVEVLKDHGGHPVSLARLSAGQYFGEMSLILESPASATVVAASDCVLRTIDRDVFNRLLQKEPKKALPLLKVLFERLRVMNVKYADAIDGQNGALALTAALQRAAQAAPKGGAGAGAGAAPSKDSILVLRGDTEETQGIAGRDGTRILKFPFRIGRKTGGALADVFAFNDLYILDHTPYQISRNHCSIEIGADGRLRVIDRGSTLGTLVNGVKLSAKDRATAELDRRSNTLVLGLATSPYRFTLDFIDRK